MSETAPNTSHVDGPPGPPGDIGAEYEHSCKVAINFVKQYYTMMHSDPTQLHRFYVSESAYVHGGNESGKCQPALGQKQIQEKVDSLHFSNCHASIKQIDSLPALGNGILIQVTGELSTRGSPMRAFVQSFVLSQDGPKKYSIVGDIFRYQEDGDSNDEESEPCSADLAVGEDGVTDENGDFTSQEIVDPPSDPSPPPVPSSDTPAVPAGSQPISVQLEPGSQDWGLDAYEGSDVAHYNGPEYTGGESFPAETADSEDTQQQPTPQDDTLLGSYPEPAEESHTERGVSGGEQEREREREQGGDTGGHGSSSYAFVSSIHTPQTAAKIAEPKFQTRTVYPPKKKPVSGGLVARPVRESRPTGPMQSGGYRPKFESANRPRESFQIFVGGLPKECSEVELKECFGKHAAVVDVRTNPSGFGFVGFASEDQVARIIEQGDRYFSIRGSFIRVERKGSSAGKPIGVKKRDGQRSGTQPRYL